MVLQMYGTTLNFASRQQWEPSLEDHGSSSYILEILDGIVVKSVSLQQAVKVSTLW